MNEELNPESINSVIDDLIKEISKLESEKIDLITWLEKSLADNDFMQCYEQHTKTGYAILYAEEKLLKEILSKFKPEEITQG